MNKIQKRLRKKREKKKLKDKHECPGLAVTGRPGHSFLICGLLSGALPQPSADLQLPSICQLLCPVIRYA